MTHAFISYVSENRVAAEAIAKVLEHNGIKVWLDRNALKPGQVWLDEIRGAIRSGAYFLPLFSAEWQARKRSVANEELLLAIEELRLRPSNQAWLIPIKLNACEIPDIPIGLNRTIHDLHHLDFSRTIQADAYIQLLQGIGVSSPCLPSSVGTTGWPVVCRFRRNDRYISKVPLRYFCDGEEFRDTASDEFEVEFLSPGTHTFYCDTAYYQAPAFYTRGGKIQGTYWAGRSADVTLQLSSGHTYEFVVSADNLYRRTVASPYAELVRELGRLFDDKAVDLDDPKTWPKISFNGYRID